MTADIIYAFTEYELPDGEYRQAVFEDPKACPVCGGTLAEQLMYRRWDGESEAFVETWRCECGERIMVCYRPIIPAGVSGDAVDDFLAEARAGV